MEKQTTFTGRIRKLEGTPVVNISHKIIEDIRMLHRMYPNREWSGVLLYKIEGELPKAKIFVEDWVLLDIGVATFTSFDFDDPSFQEHLFENPHLIDYSVGWIHTHHSMSTFFSGTDKAAFDEIAGTMSLALSVITNKAEDHIAQIGFHGKCESSTINHRGTVTSNDSFEGLLYWECDVRPILYTNSSILDQIKKVEARKKREKEEMKKKHSQNASLFQVSQSGGAYRNSQTNVKFSKSSNQHSNQQLLNAFTQAQQVLIDSSKEDEIVQEAFYEADEIDAIVCDSVYDLNTNIMSKLIEGTSFENEDMLMMEMIFQSSQGIGKSTQILQDLLTTVNSFDEEDLLQIVGWNYLDEGTRFKLGLTNYINMFMSEYRSDMKERVSETRENYSMLDKQFADSTRVMNDFCLALNMELHKLNKDAGETKDS